MESRRIAKQHPLIRAGLFYKLTVRFVSFFVKVNECRQQQMNQLNQLEVEGPRLTDHSISRQ
jgi:hypothetical protein